MEESWSIERMDPLLELPEQFLHAIPSLSESPRQIFTSSEVRNGVRLVSPGKEEDAVQECSTHPQLCRAAMVRSQFELCLLKFEPRSISDRFLQRQKFFSVLLSEPPPFRMLLLKTAF